MLRKSFFTAFWWLLLLPNAAFADNIDLTGAAKTFIYYYWQEWSSENQEALAFVNSNVGSSIIFYGGIITHPSFMNIEEEFVARWPVRNYSVQPSSMSVNCNDLTSICHLSGIVNWDDKSPARDARSIGTANFSFDLYVMPATEKPHFSIVSQSGSLISRSVGSIESFSNQSTGSAVPSQLQSNSIQDVDPSENGTELQTNQIPSTYQKFIPASTSPSVSSESILGRIASIIGLSIVSVLAIFVFLYFVPTAVSLARHSKMSGIVFILNLVLGWTVLGWFCALLIALFSQSRESYEIQSAQISAIRGGGRMRRDPRL